MRTAKISFTTTEDGKDAKRLFDSVTSFDRPKVDRFTPDLVINTHKNEYYLPHLEVPMTLDQVSEYATNMIESARKLTRGEEITSIVLTLVVHDD